MDKAYKIEYRYIIGRYRGVAERRNNMIIMTQDKKRLINTDNITGIYITNKLDKQYRIGCCFIQGAIDEELGVYETELSAEKMLEYIYESIGKGYKTLKMV